MSERTMSDSDNQPGLRSLELGIGVGIPSRANFPGGLKVREELEPVSAVVTAFSVDNKKYLSTDRMDRSAGARSCHVESEASEIIDSDSI